MMEPVKAPAPQKAVWSLNMACQAAVIGLAGSLPERWRAWRRRHHSRARLARMNVPKMKSVIYVVSLVVKANAAPTAAA